MLDDLFLISVGATPQFYIPQTIGGSVFSLGLDGRPTLWQIMHGFAVLHFRFPYKL
ncbi:MAG: hypothetical protein H0U74_07015 [Bradymonadaceae bacterium]|nr:hypothetical protein [Lujinxingiaceae bacterium]